SEPPGAAFDSGKQQGTAVTTTIIIMHRKTGQLAHIGRIEAVQGGTTDDHPVTLDHQLVIDGMLKTLTRTSHPHGTLLPGFEPLPQSTYISQLGRTQLLITMLRDHGTDAVAGEQLAQ